MRTDPDLAAYLRDIRGTPLLTAEEEKELAGRVARGDPQARDHFARANLRLVVKIARGYAGRGLPLADLVAEGNLGLLRAVDKFDPSLGYRFGIYATCCIKRSIKRALANTARTIRLPDNLESRAGAQGDRDDGRASVDAILPDRRERSPEAVAADAEEARRVRHLLDELGGREAHVLRLRFGVGGWDPLSLREVSQRLGLSHERVRQIEREGLAKLARSLRSA